ncbi:hypothetical protein [Leptospira meyeri]|uniref:hypothetical protein n=1 Tax=Leptospira meyeri TaxID=29508 RepID=UPI00223E14C4|nr:hypothetical protein [Leptospira meyeri]MCW7490878.1 hypothetical protein [Leptospira meyeri]
MNAPIYRLLNKYIPNFVSILKPKEKQLSEIYNTFLEYENNIRKEYPFGEDIQTNGSLAAYLYILETHPQERVVSILKYLDNICNNLNSTLNEKQLSSVRKEILLPMIKVPNPKQSRFSTALGEISVLNSIIANRNATFKQCEFKLPNNKNIDLSFDIKGKDIFVEIVNILDVKSNLLENLTDMHSFFDHRLLGKLRNKLENLDLNKYLIFLQPVIWGDIDKLLIFKSFFDDYQKKSPNILNFTLIGEYRTKETNELIFAYRTIKERFIELENYIVNP